MKPKFRKMLTTKKGINELISTEAHKILNKVKADKDFKDKGMALDYIIMEYGKEHKI